MDAFRNYEGVLNNINEAAAQKNAVLDTMTNVKSRNDEIMKTVGEAKAVLTGRNIIQKVGKVLKPRIQKKLDEAGEYVKSKVKAGTDEIKQKLNQTFKDNGAGPGEESRLDALRAKVARQEQGRGEGTEMQEVAPNQSMTSELTGDGQPNVAFDPEAAGDFKLLQPTETLQSTGGFDAGDAAQFNSTMAETRMGNFQNPVANLRANKFAPENEDSQSTTVPRSTPSNPDVQATPDPATAPDGSRQVVKDGEKVGEKEVEGDVGDVGGEEAAAGVLDAIPGLDVLGVIGGAVMAGVAEHKAKLAAIAGRTGQLQTQFSVGRTYQSGIGDD
tara:strand:- start:390 stop:1376 length:987 start_codon:yes stop_codon:yes gene_type:complete